MDLRFKFQKKPIDGTADGCVYRLLTHTALGGDLPEFHAVEKSLLQDVPYILADAGTNLAELLQHVAHVEVPVVVRRIEGKANESGTPALCPAPNAQAAFEAPAREDGPR